MLMMQTEKMLKNREITVTPHYKITELYGAMPLALAKCSILTIPVLHPHQFSV